MSGKAKTTTNDEFAATQAPKCRFPIDRQHCFDITESDAEEGQDRVTVRRCGYCGCRVRTVFVGGAGNAYVGSLPQVVRYDR